MATFIGGFVIAFIKGWLLTLVMLTSIPPLVISGSAMSIMIAKMASRGQNAYAKAATVVEQTLGSIRTVLYPCKSYNIVYIFRNTENTIFIRFSE